MKPGLKGNLLPECRQDAEQLWGLGKLTFLRCMNCNRDLASAGAASSIAGWRETQISGVCESCFDAMFEGNDD